ncbi:hypothetical protein M9H77_12313 [Catharanthus roseus]|uniref:Uncharacterized protein n=1 Tax=Catharanthus roseus TaxID=4058 RepID=A0ACC0BH67_CATRO|nr:hypothetical protein M9H77_12313 [Catharanthus roseus]
MTEHVTSITHMVFYELFMLYPTVDDDDDENDHSDEEYAVSSELELDDNNDAKEEELQTPESSQWFSSARYNYAQFGAFLDMGSDSTIDDLVEYGTLRLLDWNDSMTDIQLGMRFVDKVQAISAVQQYKHRNMSSKFISMSISHLVANDVEIPVSNVIQEVHVLFQMGCTYKRACCGKSQAHTLPCSHALVICRENSTRADTYVLDIYSRETYRRTYQSNFYPVLNENFWRDVPYNLTFHPPNMNNERSRKQGTRFRGEMDHRNLDFPPRMEHVVCRDVIEKIVIIPVKAMYKFVFLKVL